MANCVICATRLTILNTGLNNKSKDGERLCLKCLKKLDNSTIKNLSKLSTEEIIEAFNSINSKKTTNKIDNIEKVSPTIKRKAVTQNYIIEYKRTCNECGKTWHVLADREKYLEKEQAFNQFNLCASALGNLGGNNHSWGVWTQGKRNEHALKEAEYKLKRCPNCYSENYTQTELRYEKK